MFQPTIFEVPILEALILGITSLLGKVDCLLCVAADLLFPCLG